MIQANELRELLTVSGTKFDGHVTHGSVEAQMQAMDARALELAGYFMRVAGVIGISIPAQTVEVA